MKIDRVKIKNMFGGKCAYCGCELGDRWHVDHVDPVKRHAGDIIFKPDGTYKIVSSSKMFRPENHNDKNLYPACIPCNIHKSASTVEEFRRVLKGHIRTLNEASNHSIYRHAKRFSLVVETGSEVEFWFERYIASDGVG